MPFNGPGYEPSPNLPDGLSYCVQCGTVMVFHSQRDCPSCTLADRLEEIEERLGELTGDDEAIDERIEDVERRLERAERDLETVDGGGY
ncbi:hypothetical protein [Natrinema pallidum]|uniref:hypothetical protein n=1 Tax=Natrinema pallidum TaxID=69527 RepID=UPI0037536463